MSRPFKKFKRSRAALKVYDKFVDTVWANSKGDWGRVFEKNDVPVCPLCGFEANTDDCECRVLYAGQWVNQTKETQSGNEICVTRK